MSSRKRNAASMSTAALKKRARKFESQRGLPISFRQKPLMVVSKETGYVDTTGITYGLDNTGAIRHINVIPQGTSVNQRVGKKVALKSIQLRGSAIGRADAVSNDYTYIIVYDKRPTGVLPAITDILDSIDPQSMNNDANAGRFRILKRVDNVLVGGTSLTGAVANTLTEATMRNEDWYLPLNNLQTVFKAATTGVIADVEQGALYIVTLGNQVSGTTAAQLRATIRVRFVDI